MVQFQCIRFLSCCMFSNEKTCDLQTTSTSCTAQTSYHIYYQPSINLLDSSLAIFLFKSPEPRRLGIWKAISLVWGFGGTFWFWLLESDGNGRRAISWHITWSYLTMCFVKRSRFFRCLSQKVEYTYPLFENKLYVSVAVVIRSFLLHVWCFADIHRWCLGNVDQLTTLGV